MYEYFGEVGGVVVVCVGVDCDDCGLFVVFVVEEGLYFELVDEVG